MNRLCLYLQMPNRTTSRYDDLSFYSLLVVSTGILNLNRCKSFYARMQVGLHLEYVTVLREI